ncbi:membrane fusion protein, cobalt-zinc-cadmium efflux system [Singulisphaera sp. GP187]|uniref:efflux RND transporter periplasmic adaptor subunit n=1 Tax=Singulisphaera sp. GP187 TaxID=1882752 RepID=UPI000927D651|nr:efflux RND transporter periplasmic adaptor subunit [Singulisphaera sp. GP187]SIO34240.1 membrane fusion protein, cobalt-zinc-cadmium efflux system [Singulisphaera sp. GP187]
MTPPVIPTHTPAEPGPATRGQGRSRSKTRRAAIAAVLLAGAGTLAYLGWSRPAQVRNAWASLTGPLSATLKAADTGPTPPAVRPPWDGFVTLKERGRASMGVATMTVAPQTDPIRLELLGTSEYDSETLSQIRFMFKGRVDKVYRSVGQTVKKGDPLIDLYSTELAEAKSAYEIKRIQWTYDKTLLDARTLLVKGQSISQQLFAESQNNELKSRREYEVARDNLLVYGLSEAEVEAVKDQVGSQKARMTVRSPAAGIIITRDVVVGNLYDEDDTLLVIAPLDHLWVWGNVFENDIDLVHLGQSWEVHFPFLNHKLQGKVEYIANRVDPGTHAVRIRTSVPNPEGRLKADMLVRGLLDVPPVPGWTVIPRTALVVADRQYYVFVKVPGRTDKYERRTVGVAQEKEDHVVVETGLRAGEEIVSVGSLLVAQLYDDLKTVQTGAPIGGGPIVDER